MYKEIDTHHPVYQAIQEYDFLLSPLAAATLGFVNLGPYGAAAGITLGSIDLVANHYKIYDKHYLTYTTLGWGAAYQFEAPYHLNQVLGATLGSLLPTGIFDNHFDKTIAPATGALYGELAIGGQYGIAIGITAGIIDEALNQCNINKDYHLSSSLSNMATLNLYTSNLVAILPSYLQFINSLTFKISITGLISALSIYNNDEDEELEESSIMYLSNNLYDSMNKTIPQEQLDDILETRNIATTALNLLGMKATLALASYQQNIAQGFHALETKGFDNFFRAFINFSQFIPIIVINTAIVSFIKSYFAIKIHNIIHDNTYNELMNDEVSLYLSKNHSSTSINSNTLLQNIDEDIDYLIETGNSLLTNQMSSILKGIYSSACMHANGASDMILISQNYNDITSFITTYLSNKVEEDTETIKELESKITSLNEYTRTHASEMTQNDATSFVLEIHNEVSDNLKDKTAKKSYYESLYHPWRQLHGLIDFFFNYLVIAYKINKGELNNDKRFEVLFIINDVSSMIGWETSNIAELTKLNQSMTRFNQFNDLMDEVNIPIKHQPIYTYIKSPEIKICFNDLSVGIKDEVILNLHETCISGKNIAITGASGSGKTSFFKILKQIKHDEVWSEGNIEFHTLSQDIPKISMVSQKTYIPPYVSLLELITYKKGEKALGQEEKAIDLLKEIGINSISDNKSSIDIISRINEVESWENKLSGGQIQKIAIVKMIIEQPDFILCDEIFKGLDSESIAIVKKMLDKYLPNTQLLIIDHEAKAHNLDGFYDNNLHFYNKTAIIGELNIEESAETIFP